MTWILPLGAALVSWLVAGWLRQYALARRMVDIPSPRGSHDVETPRGGGGAIVVAAWGGLAWNWWSGDPNALPPAVLAGGLLVAVVGFVDDHHPLPPIFRLICHFVVATLAVYGFGGVGFGIPGDIAAVVYVAWMINLTNFMDGIDGIAGSQTVTVCGAAAVLSTLVVSGGSFWQEPSVLAAAAAGFLAWNWPPARVFMGDVGSGFIGFMVAAFSLRAAAVAPELGWSWIILFAVFIVDASIALLRRAARRDRLFQAHRTHAYQHLAQAWGSHRPVTLLVVAINIFWLAPVAFLVVTQRLGIVPGLLIAYLPVVIGAVRLGAGVERFPQ